MHQLQEHRIPDLAEQSGIGQIRVKALARALLKVLRLHKLQDVYRESAAHAGAEFAEEILKKLGIEVECKQSELDQVPKLSPFILVSNHPYGGIDGLILLSLVLKTRPDFRIMANYLLESIPQLADHIVPVNPFDHKKGEQINLAGVKKSLKLLSEGIPVGIFPAGEVSSFSLKKMKVSDKVWHPVVGKMIMRANVKVVPVFFSGHNSVLFNALGLVHPHLRTARLPSELFNKSGKITVRIGKPLPAEMLQDFDHPDQLLRFLRAKTYSLGSSLDVKQHFRVFTKRNEEPDTIISETDPHLVEHDIAAIREKDLLFTHENLSVFYTEALRAPNVLREISRLREITFREAGEGTNNSSDADEFDLHYKHLFLWDEKERRIAGAYRIGDGHRIFKRFKRKGFYLNTLFRFTREFDPILESSLELGRSFIVRDYQRKPYPLLLLWRGIHQVVRTKPERYKYLIGPVSISSRFSGLSRDLLVDYITRNHFDHSMAEWVKPRKQYHYHFNGEAGALRKAHVSDIKLLDQIISDIESGTARIPVLLKKYLAQHGRIIAFSVDPAFNNSLDGFLLMRLRDVPPETFGMMDEKGG